MRKKKTNRPGLGVAGWGKKLGEAWAALSDQEKQSSLDPAVQAICTLAFRMWEFGGRKESGSGKRCVEFCEQPEHSLGTVLFEDAGNLRVKIIAN